MLSANSKENEMDSIGLFFIGASIVHLILVIFALKDLFTLAHIRLVGKVIWILVIVYPMVIGPLVYLHYGRGERSWNNKIHELQQRALEKHAENEESVDK